VGADTLLAQIVRLVSEAQRSQAPIQREADRIASWFVPAVFLVAAITFVVWLLLGPQPRLVFGLVNAISVLIVACPCALGLATPMSIMVASGKGATTGILIRDAATLEKMSRVRTLAMDKTGTLTEGKPDVVAVVTDGDSEQSVLQAAMALEMHSEHPLAGAIVQAALSRGIKQEPGKEFGYLPGKGLTGRLGQQSIVVGSRRLMDEQQIKVPDAIDTRLAPLQKPGCSVVLVARDNKVTGAIVVSDPIKPTSQESLAQLRAMGIQAVMLTGDAAATASSIGAELGFKPGEVFAELLPADKSATIHKLQASGGAVAMAGDGVNDAVALAAADVGIAMGSGSGVAVETAGVTLVKSDLRNIPRAFNLSRATMSNIRQNLFFAFIYNTVGILIATGIFYPWFGMLLNPMVAAAAMSLSSVCVITNALRLRSSRL
jgi:P-type Cu+ transporter